MKSIPLVGVAVFMLLCLHARQEVQPPTIQIIMGTTQAVMPDEIMATIPAAKKTSWPATTRPHATADTQLRCQKRAGE